MEEALHGAAGAVPGAGCCAALEPDGPQAEAPPRAAGLGAFGAFLLLTKINWGIGMVAMPYYLHCAGLWCGLAFFAVSMVLAADTAVCLARCRERARSCARAGTYAELIGALLGPWGRAAAVGSLALANWGSAVAWLRFIGDNLARFLPEAQLSGQAWTVGITVPVLACALAEDVAPLERLSVLGLAAGQAFVVLVLAQAAPQLAALPAYARAQPAVRWASAPVAMGLAVFCNEGMVVVTPAVHAAMRRPRQFPRAVAAMIIYFTANYLLIAVAGDFLFGFLRGGIVASEVSLDFSTTPLHRAAVLLYILQLLLTFPLVFFAVFSSLERAWLPRAPRRWRRALRTLVIALAGTLAVAVPRFGDFIAAAGGLANSLGIYVLPHLALLRAAARGELKLGAARRLLSGFVTGVFGVLAGAVATDVSVAKLFG